MAGNGLIDTGAILALLDRRDDWHDRCRVAFRQMRLPLWTSEAVLTEVFHLVDGSQEVRAAWKFVRSGAITIAPISSNDFPVLDALMHQYRDRPMDFADATLVRIAERESINLILTIDHGDFETYRIQGRRRFRIVPART
jgi:predicted nucleic acid-binding protein